MLPVLDLLRGAPVVGLLAPDALRVVGNVADRRDLRAGETLFRAGERSDGGYVVLSGEIGVDEPDGRSAVHGPGALIGRTALFMRGHRPADAVARTDAAVLRISPTLMKRVLEEYPEGIGPIGRAISSDLDGLRARLDTLHGSLVGRSASAPDVIAPASP